ncbi:MAG: ABC transporter permease [Bacillota bacterium]|nr:ABC transporter permease [Bacillota bacterium]
MTRYLARRLLSMIPVLLGITLITFLVMQVVPGDPLQLMVDPKGRELDPETIRAIKAKWGLDLPVHLQYLRFLGNAVRGDLGFSYRFNRDVNITVLERIPATATLAIAAMLLAMIIGVTLGIASAVRHRTWFDVGSMVFALAGVSTPIFWLGLMMMYLFGVVWKVLPPSGYGTWRNLIMPSVALGLSSSGVLARLTRSSMLNVVRTEYITTARAKGLSERTVIYRHALKNALIPVITILGVQTGSLLSGAVVTETVFAWPGVGRLLMESIMNRDLPVIQGCVLLIATIFLFVNVIVDINYALIDPRIRYR